jgi:excisionase family DNA binding protein
MENEKLLKASQIADILGISRSKAYAMMRRREIPTIVLGKNVRVNRRDLEAFISQNREYEGEIKEIIK